MFLYLKDVCIELEEESNHVSIMVYEYLQVCMSFNSGNLSIIDCEGEVERDGIHLPVDTCLAKYRT